MHDSSYRLVVASILFSEHDKRQGCRPYQLLEYLRQVVKYDDESHNSIVFHIEHSTRFAVELRISCERASTFLLTIQQDSSEERVFHKEHYLEANKMENYIIDVGETIDRTLTLFRVDEDSSWKTLSLNVEDTSKIHTIADIPVIPIIPVPTHKIRKSSSFLKRLRFSRYGCTYQIALSKCDLNAWHQHSLSTIASNSVITFRIMRNSEDVPNPEEVANSEQIGDDLYKLTQNIITFDAEQQCERYRVREYDGDLGFAGDAVLDLTFQFGGLPYICKKILILAVLLGWHDESIELSERAIPLALTQLRTCSHSKARECSLASAKLSHAAESFTRQTLRKNHTMTFFPPIRQNFLASFSRRIELAISLRNLELWRHFPEHSSAASLTNELETMIIEEVEKWLAEKRCDLADSLSSLADCFSFFSDAYLIFFAQFDIPYAALVFRTIERKLSKRAGCLIRKELRDLDAHSDDSLEQFTKNTMKLFDGFKNIAQIAKASRVKDSELFMYETWFSRCTIFWTYTWRTMCRQLTLRALDEDDNQDIGEDRVLPSGVNFLAIHKAVCEDYAHLGLHNSTNALMCILKIAVTVADDLLIYSKRMHDASQKFDPTKRMLAANTIEHICKFVKNTTIRLLDIDELESTLPSHEFQQASASLNQILYNAVEQCKGVSILIVTNMCRERRDSISKQCQSITQADTKKRKKNLGWLRAVLSRERSDHLLAYLDRFCSQTSATLLPRLSDIAREEMLQISESAIVENLQKGQPPLYYRQIQSDYDMIRRMMRIDNRNVQSALRDALFLNAYTTEQLILQYYAQLADRNDFCTPCEQPIIRLRVGYIPTTNQQVLVQIDVLGASNLPILDEVTKSSDAHCRVEVMPRYLFPLSQFHAQITTTKKHTLNPIWEEQFQLALSEDLFFVNGSVLCLNVLEHELLSCNNLAGQAYIQLSRIPRIQSLCTKHRPPVVRLPLLLPSKQQFNGTFQVLVERACKDSLAREVCDYERHLHDYHMLPACANTRVLRRHRTFRKLLSSTRLRCAQQSSFQSTDSGL